MQIKWKFELKWIPQTCDTRDGKRMFGEFDARDTAKRRREDFFTQKRDNDSRQETFVFSATTREKFSNSFFILNGTFQRFSCFTELFLYFFGGFSTSSATALTIDDVNFHCYR